MINFLSVKQDGTQAVSQVLYVRFDQVLTSYEIKCNVLSYRMGGKKVKHTENMICKIITSKFINLMHISKAPGKSSSHGSSNSE